MLQVNKCLQHSSAWTTIAADLQYFYSHALRWNGLLISIFFVQDLATEQQSAGHDSSSRTCVTITADVALLYCLTTPPFSLCVRHVTLQRYEFRCLETTVSRRLHKEGTNYVRLKTNDRKQKYLFTARVDDAKVCLPTVC